MNISPALRWLLPVFATFALGSIAHAAPSPDGLEESNVTWDSPGKNYKDSMPIGNGDIGLNVWTEQNGDLVLLIGKTDAWTENAQLVKLGRVRVSFKKSIIDGGSKFSQQLRLREGEIEIVRQGRTIRIWVDAQHPVAHIEFSGGAPSEMQAKLELWRLKPRETLQGGEELTGTGVLREWNNLPEGKLIIDPDTILPAKKDELVWCHRNERSLYPLSFGNQHLESLLPKYPDPLLGLTFGVSMKGPGLVSSGDTTLKSEHPAATQRLDLVVLTQQTKTLPEWQAALDKTVASVQAIDLEAARKAHRQWWAEFWNRSWIHVGGAPETEKVTQGYAMQRWMNACAGRGRNPMKYNGSIFTVGEEPDPASYDPAKGQRDADFRSWGGNYWFQNTRLLYWPMIAAGDFDLLAPFLKMYADALPLARDRTQLYFKHDGAYFPETIHFWGSPNNNDFGWNNPENLIKNTWIRHYVSGGLELTAMLLDRYDYTQDQDFARQTLLPIASGVTTYYNQHWQRNASGKIHFDPAQGLETYQQAVNPTPDIAGLRHILPRLISLPLALVDSSQRTLWEKMLADLPSIPLGKTNGEGKIPLEGKAVSSGKAIILPAEKYSKPANVENVEMYTVFPYRIYGIGKPGLDIARNTYAARLFKSSTCWGHDGLDSALLGLTDLAKAEAIANFTAYGGERFKWFWTQGHDYEPDMDNGGAGMSILQLMLLQCEGKTIRLLPAWPTNWEADFKLHAPYQTTIEGKVRGGKLTQLKITPESRRRDLIIGAK